MCVSRDIAEKDSKGRGAPSPGKYGSADESSVATNLDHWWTSEQDVVAELGEEGGAGAKQLQRCKGLSLRL